MIYISKLHKMMIRNADAANQPPWNTGPSTSMGGERGNITVKVPQKIMDIKIDQDRSKGKMDRRTMNWGAWNSAFEEVLKQQEQEEENNTNAEQQGEV